MYDWGKEQEKEIATIKERTIYLNLSDADCKRISTYAAKANITVSQLLESFIGDLVNGTYTNGSDELVSVRVRLWKMRWNTISQL